VATNPIGGDAAETVSVFQSDLPLKEKLERARTELLDLSARNRLLNMPRSSKSVRALEVVDEISAEVFRLLVKESRVFTFLAGKSAKDETAEGDSGVEEGDEIQDLAQPDDETDERGVFARHSDTRLQTRLTSKGLQKRLLDLYFDARTLEEEQGVNILYLTLGALKWIDPQNAANIRYAPLVLVPVSLERGNAGEKFKLRLRPEDYASNLSLEAFLDRVHGIKLPAFEASEAFDPSAYFAEVSEAVSAKPGWEVMPDNIVLGFFSFAKFLMYRDLDPDNWPSGGKIIDRELVRRLLSDGFDGSDQMIPEDSNIDPFIPPAEMLHIVDSDSSQALAVHEVRRGRNLVIQGPPGTGKSQTIANIIASAVADGKSVLFVAEKMAALEVVKRRLDATGVGDACLELHSNKANKRALLEELRRTWELGAPRGQLPGTLNARLTEARDRLNAHVVRMHAPHEASGLTPFQVVGQLCRLRHDGEKPSDIALVNPGSWSADQFAERCGVLADLVDRIEMLGTPGDHPWFGVGLSAILPTDVERLTARIAELASIVEAFDQDLYGLAALLEAERSPTAAGLEPLALTAERVAQTPEIHGQALGSSAWEDRIDDIFAILARGTRLAALREELRGVVNDTAWTADLTEPMAALASLPAHFSLDAFARAAELAAGLPKLLTESAALARALGREAPATLSTIGQMARIGERVAAAPDASPEAFAADLWDDGVERASDLAEAVARLERARATVSGGLSDAAWTMDLGQARSVLAAHGTGLFRFLSGEWRRASRLVKSVLTRSDAPLNEVLAYLDALASGQKALREIEADDAFGRSAFGIDWRGDRSTSAPLIALVEWMRSLRGLGAEPRLIASKRPEKADIEARARRTGTLHEELAAAASQFWTDLASTGVSAFGDEEARDADVNSLLAFAMRVSTAGNASAGIFHDVPANLGERRRFLDLVLDGQEAAVRLVGEQALGEAAFGNQWHGPNGDWAWLTAAAEWVRENLDIRILASRIQDRAEPLRLASGLRERRADIAAGLSSLFDQLQLDRDVALGSSNPESLDLTALTSRLHTWAASGEQLSQWVGYRDRATQASALGCGDIVGRLSDGRLRPEQAIPAFEMAYYEAVYAEQVQNDPELGSFDGTLHGRLAREFADMDRQRISAASFEVVRAHHQAVPARDGGSVGPLGVLRAEIARKRGHMPIRRLMERAAPAVQALKPVFMMSPLSVAQFLAPGVFDFDLLVMDEASQIQPVDALGAVARAKQVVVVGDPKQLPPSWRINVAG
jgi:hypothetical protein